MILQTFDFVAVSSGFSHIDIADWSFLATGEGAEKPCPFNGLGLEVVGYLLVHHLVTHKRIISDLWCKYSKMI